MQFGVSESIAHWGKYRPSSCAVVRGSTQISFGELNHNIDKVAHEISAKMSEVERVGVAIKSKYQFLTAVVGVLRAGKSAVILNTGLPSDTLTTNMNDADITALIHDASNEKCRIFRGDAFPMANLSIEGILDDSACSGHVVDEWPVRAPTDEWGVLYSSGTTGIPKGIERDHNSIVTELLGWCLELGLTRKTTFYIGRPVYYTGGLVLTLSTLLVGGRVVLNDFQNDNDASEAWTDYQRASDRLPLSWAFFVPDQLRWFMRAAEGSSSPPGGAEMVLVMGASISGDEKMGVSRILGSGVVESWGNSESLGTITEPDDLNTRPNSVGRPFISDELYIVDEDCRFLGPNQLGRIAGSEEAGFCKYCNRPEATNFAKRDRLIVSEDIGYTDSDGYFYVRGRHQDCIVRDGVTILKPAIEAKVRRCRLVQECCVVASAGGDGPVRLTAVVVPEDGAHRSEHELLGDLNAMLDPSERLDALRYIKSMPRVPSGKVDRVAVGRLVEEP